MKELTTQGIAATNGIRLPASLRRKRNASDRPEQHGAKKMAVVRLSTAGTLLPETSVAAPEVSSLTLLIFSWMHRRKVALTGAADSTTVR